MNVSCSHMSIQKIFKCIWLPWLYDVLIKILYLYIVCGVLIMLIKRYVRYRCQFVQINKNRSNFITQAAGVPQISILWALLFNLYNNEIVNTDNNTTFIIYAYDTNVFFCGGGSFLITGRSNKFMSKLNAWAVWNS